ncbi:MAG: nuclear transport factor 2 family protein [Candidatus Eisenbacteria bacterium]|nr:nuclear transport factor 2 family protein [Candidatus Eisenbacteria bacterium]
MKRVMTTSAVLAIAVALLIPMAAGAESDMSRINQQRKAIGRALVEINAENWASLLQYYEDDIEYHDPIVTIEGIGTMAEFLGRLFAGGPDLITTVEDETCINGMYSATWTMAGSLAGVPYTAKGMSVIKFRPRSLKAYYSRDYYSEGDIMIGIPELAGPVSGFRTFYRCAVDPTFDCPLEIPTAKPLPDGGAMSEESISAPSAFGLRQNVPNPFNPTTTIAFEVPDGGARVSLEVYDVSGRLVRTLVDGHEPAGTRTVTWDGRDDEGQPVASGIYFSRMTAPEFSETTKMILMK